MAPADYIVFPDNPANPGDTWTTEVNNPQVKGKKVTTKFTFDGIDKGVIPYDRMNSKRGYQGRSCFRHNTHDGFDALLGHRSRAGTGERGAR